MNHLHLKRAVALGAVFAVMGVSGAFAATTLDSAVNVMAGPGVKFKTVAHLTAGENVAITQVSKDWCKISGPATGWIPCSDTQTPVKKSAAAAPSATGGFSGYDWSTDPMNGPGGQFGLHSNYNGTSM